MNRTRISKTLMAAVALAVSVLTSCAGAVKPNQIPQPSSFNSYTPEQDIEIGKQAAEQARQQVTVVNNQQLQNYVKTLGERLARQPQAGDYPYSFTLINDPSINAFALPGGPVFINSGILQNADNEAQVAGVMAHEISHVALRHGTSNATKAELFNMLGTLGAAALPQAGAAAQIGQLGLSLGISTVLLKYSRTAESQADALGARIMASAGYDPVQMARFFQKLEEGGGGGETAQFLSDHPNPGNRVKAVEAEIPYIPEKNFNANTGEFPQMKRLAQGLRPPPQQQQAAR